jgi:hypothetical protein
MYGKLVKLRAHIKIARGSVKLSHLPLLFVALSPYANDLIRGHLYCRNQSIKILNVHITKK